jgi:hypothetical protein
MCEFLGEYVGFFRGSEIFFSGICGFLGKYVWVLGEYGAY